MPLFDVRLNVFRQPRVGWDRELERRFRAVRVLGADVDHGTFDCPIALVDEVLAFMAPEYHMEPNTTGAILCAAVDLSE